MLLSGTILSKTTPGGKYFVDYPTVTRYYGLFSKYNSYSVLRRPDEGEASCQHRFQFRASGVQFHPLVLPIEVILPFPHAVHCGVGNVDYSECRREHVDEVFEFLHLTPFQEEFDLLFIRTEQSVRNSCLRRDYRTVSAVGTES